jgi:hypothetical protein
MEGSVPGAVTEGVTLGTTSSLGSHLACVVGGIRIEYAVSRLGGRSVPGRSAGGRRPGRSVPDAYAH